MKQFQKRETRVGEASHTLPVLYPEFFWVHHYVYLLCTCLTGPEGPPTMVGGYSEKYLEFRTSRLV